MSLIVEDGSMPEGANSYVSLEQADAYLVPRGLWAQTPEEDEGSIVTQKEAALLRAFDALNALKWVGTLPDWQRTIAWPRKDVPLPGQNGREKPEYVPDNVVPKAVGQAQMELAALILGGHDPLAPVERGGKVISYSESSSEGSIDVIGGDSESHSVTFSEAAPVETYLPSVYPLIAHFLREIPGKAASFVIGNALRG